MDNTIQLKHAALIDVIKKFLPFTKAELNNVKNFRTDLSLTDEKQTIIHSKIK